MVKRFYLGSLALVASLVLAACGTPAEPASPSAPTPTEAPAPTVEPTAEVMEEMESSIAEIAAGNPDFSTLVSLLDAAGLVETLSGEGTFTVFAPTNAAFEAVPAEILDMLAADTELLTQVLLYHVAGEVLLAEDVVAATSATTLEGSDVSIEVVGSEVILNDSATVITTDITASNGVIHVIDAVILPPAVAEMIAESMMEEEPTEAATGNSIAEIAASNPDFSTLVSLLDAAGLVETLAGEGTFTVFAPTNEAFEAVPAEVLDALAADTDLLTQVLLYHVAGDVLLAEDVVAATSATTLEGSDVTIEVVGDQVVLNDSANVIATDIIADNGVIHVIDAVILPPDVAELVAELLGGTEEGTGNSIAEIAASNPEFSTLVSLLEAADLVETLAGEGTFTVFAPTDEAFAAVPAEILDALAANPELLTQVLLYHVAGDVLLAEDVVAADSATTLEGSDVTIEVVDGGVVLNGTVNVTATDIIADNGVIHVIDAVLLPESVVEALEAL